MDSQWKTTENIFFVDPISLTDLCSIYVTLTPTSSDSVPLAASNQAHVLKCREIIYTDPEIIATPILNKKNMFIIIMKQSYYKSGKLLFRLQKLGLKAEKPRRISRLEFNDCARYTILAKLAPNWNKVGEFLVQGRDFLSNSFGKHNAVKFQLNVRENEIYITLEGLVIKIPSLELEDLGLCHNVISQFRNQRPNGFIHEYSIARKWCYVLPSMKQGQVINVTHRISQGGQLKSYKDLKRHWKNNYGYRIPEDDTMCFCEVYFKPVGEMLFTYPMCCVKPGPVIIMPRADPKPIISAFLDDFKKRVPSLCGFPLDVSKVPNFHTSQLQELDEIQDQLHVNVSQRQETVSSNFGFRKYDTSNLTSIESKTSITNQTLNNKEQDDGTKSQRQMKILKEHPLDYTSNLTSIESKTSITNQTLNSKKQEDGTKSQKQVKILKERPLDKRHLINQESFQQQKPDNISTNIPSIYTITSGQDNQASGQKFLPRFFPVKSKSGAKSKISSHKLSGRHVCTPEEKTLKLNSNTLNSHEKYSKEPVMPTNGSRKRSKDTNKYIVNDRISDKSVKSSEKKPRMKAQLQRDINVVELLQANKVDKINTFTLMDWLSSKGVEYKARDSKRHLVNLALEYLRDVEAEI